MRIWLVWFLFLLSFAPTPVGAQETSLDLESWIVIEEEAAPEAPLFRFHAGLVGWIEAQTRLQVDKNGVPGTRLDDLEGESGLYSEGVGPWIELSLGDKVRGGADVTWVSRGGQFVRQDSEVVIDALRVAGPGDLLRTEFEFLTVSGFVEWDVLYGRTYRIGFLGGARYFRFEADLRAISPTGTRKAGARGELVSPYFGGLIELTPFPYLSVFVRAQFMNWSWAQIGLKEARFFEFRLGTTVNPLPGRLGFGVEFRFLSMRASGRDTNDPDTLEAALAASGVVFSVNLAF